MNFILATESTWTWLYPVLKLLGFIMNWIFEGLNAIGLPNIGLSIILFTLVIKVLLIPLSIKQQKFSRLQAVMQPELTAIQNKYKGKTDNASVMAQQEETKAVYNKYGTSMTGGCLQTLIQMPILLALYQVIYKMPGYITRLKGYYEGVADKLMGITGYASNEALITLAKANSLTKNTETLLADRNYIIDMMYNFTQTEWQEFLNLFNNADLTKAYESVAGSINKVNSFCGIDLTMTPMQQLWPAIFIPVLAGLLQWLSTKLMSTGNENKTGKEDQNSAANSMKTMNTIFPLMSVVFCFMFSAGIGVYWVASSGIQVIIQIFVNRYINKTDLNEMVEKNIEKINKKRARKGQEPLKVTNVTNSVHILEEEAKAEKERERILAERAAASSAYYQNSTTARKGSLAEKAGMVQQYDERMKELKAGKSSKKTEG